jgi:hypothetical protein
MPAEVTGDDMVAAMDAVGVDGALLVSPFTLYRYGVVNVKITKCEIIPYRVFKKTMTALCCSHVRL